MRSISFMPKPARKPLSSEAEVVGAAAVINRIFLHGDSHFYWYVPMTGLSSDCTDINNNHNSNYLQSNPTKSQAEEKVNSLQQQ